MEKYQCTVCSWVYDEITGYPEGGIPPGTRFSELPESWSCPFCNNDKDKFRKMENE